MSDPRTTLLDCLRENLHLTESPTDRKRRCAVAAPLCRGVVPRNTATERRGYS